MELGLDLGLAEGRGSDCGLRNADFGMDREGRTGRGVANNE